MRILAIAVLLLAAAASQAFAAFDPHRTVTNVDYAAKTVTCRAKPGSLSYTYKATDKTVVRLAGKRIRQSRGDFSQIKVGEAITVEYHLDGEDRVADRIVIHPAKK